MAIKIHDFRLSFVWFETNLALLEDGKTNAPFQFLGRDWSYRERFEAAQKPDAKDLMVPWPKPIGQRFWSFYLHGTPGAVVGKAAWRALVPLRGVAPFDLNAPWLKGTVSSEVFYYPYGIGWMLNVRCFGPSTLKKAVEIAFQVRDGAKFDVEWKEGTESLSLDAIAQGALPRLRALALGPGAKAGTITLVPWSVFTIVDAEGGDPDEVFPASGDIHRYLEAVSAWRPTWRKDQLRALDVAKVRIKQSAPASHVVYGTERGRAVWFPVRFLASDHKNSLSCYHRNLTLVSMHVEGLCGLLNEVDRRLQAGQTLPQGVAACAKLAADLLFDFHDGGTRTYRSGSVRAQLERNNSVPVVNRIRAYFGMEPQLA